jgi:RNA polymerase sigma-70 factor (ECF subfamily)
MNSFLSNSTAERLPYPSSVVEGPRCVPPVEREVLEMFDLLHNNLLRYSISLGLSASDGEDVLQETFLAFFHHLRAGRSRSHLRGWLFQVTHNLSLKRRAAIQGYYRTHNASSSCVEGQSDRAANPEEELLFSERQERLRSVLQVLPERDRWCLQLRAEGLRYREIAQVTGISVGSVSNSLARSLDKLARMDAR